MIRRIAIVVAAGQGRRMGGSKALLLFEGKPLVIAHIQRAKESGCEVIAVVSPSVEAAVNEMAKDATLVTSTEPDQAGSLAIALEQVDGTDAAVVITPVDAVPARLETIDILFNALGSHDAVTPTYEGKGGHPIVCASRMLLALARPLPPLREVLAALGDRRQRFDVDDPSVLIDLNDPAAYETLTGGPPRFWIG